MEEARRRGSRGASITGRAHASNHLSVSRQKWAGAPSHPIHIAPPVRRRVVRSYFHCVVSFPLILSDTRTHTHTLSLSPLSHAISPTSSLVRSRSLSRCIISSSPLLSSLLTNPPKSSSSHLYPIISASLFNLSGIPYSSLFFFYPKRPPFFAFWRSLGRPFLISKS